MQLQHICPHDLREETWNLPRLMSQHCPEQRRPILFLLSRLDNKSSHLYGLPWWLRQVKNLPAVLETWVRGLGEENPLEKGMAIPSSILAWRIPRTEETAELKSMGSQRVRHDWATNSSTFHFPVTDILSNKSIPWKKREENSGISGELLTPNTLISYWAKKKEPEATKAFFLFFFNLKHELRIT